MKLKSNCIPCLVERAKYECDIVFDNDRDKIFALQEFLTFLAEHLAEGVKSTPTFFGTERERILKKRCGVKDPHLKVKRRSTEVAKKLLPEAIRFYDAAEDKIEALIRIAAAANSMEYGVKGYLYDDDLFKAEFMHTLNEKLVWNKHSIISAIEMKSKILYLTDNAGEIIFDAFVVKAFKNMGKKVVISPKKDPILNDATIEDLKEAGISVPGSTSELKIIPSGSSIGISLDEAEEEFLDVLKNKKYLIVAKGMGNYEAISEFEDEEELGLKGRLIYIFRAKCESVAKEVGVKRGELVAKLV